MEEKWINQSQTRQLIIIKVPVNGRVTEGQIAYICNKKANGGVSLMGQELGGY